MWISSHLVVSKPYPVIYNAECEDMIHKRLTFRVVVRRWKCLQQKNVTTARCQTKNSTLADTAQICHTPGWRVPSVKRSGLPCQISVWGKKDVKYLPSCQWGMCSTYEKGSSATHRIKRQQGPGSFETVPCHLQFSKRMNCERITG